MGAPVSFPDRPQEDDVRPDRYARSADAARPQHTRRLSTEESASGPAGDAGERTRRTSGVGRDPHLGRLLDGRYRLRSRIARGGMAAVYQAHDERLDRTVAVKVMHTGLGDDEAFAERFVREARAAAKLNHPNVVAVYDQGEDDGTVYLAMELVPGHTLRDTITEQAPMSPGRALALLEPVLGALAAAHRLGMVHRDVKPENVLINADPHTGDHVKVADFGLARAVSAETQHTSTGTLIGTVSYIAPELVIDGRADARADVYAVGVILYELLTGQKPHAGETPIQVAYRHVHHDVPPVSTTVPGTPPYLDALVARATARDRDRRFADAGVMLHQLRRVTSALADGLPDDEELTADLALPAARVADSYYEPAESGSGLDGATTTVPMLVQERPAEHHDHADVPGEPPRPRTGRGGGRPSRRGPLRVAIAVLLVALLCAGVYWFGFLRYTTTPGVLGDTRAEASAALSDAGLSAEVGDPAYSDNVPKGQVVSTDPSPGDRVVDGGTVTLVLSRGPEVYRLPKLAGMSVDEAQDAIADSHLTFGQAREVWSETVADGVVMGSRPKAGTVLRPETVVDIEVSKGRRPIKVGEWAGRSAEQAEETLSDRGLKVETSEEYSDDVPQGQVISQQPQGGTLHRGDTVQLVVSQGPELVEVPGGLIASGVDDATEKLEDAGFEVKVEESPTYVGLKYVIRVDPGSGTEIPKGSTVTLYLV
ncbi:Stk1 family PASTA domain-containing Ser/Thr kinase [Nocardioides insulae]|uniref:Stk1 family PASTA domain-containing Ser/Thr kinase n=1 Tax=Nocardioides insulae TaxID=394734 RepID=UPI000A0554FE|nr:Stk1 family PASTA domain-containing Ser/Thr kinase [Nocardioides insulae]